MREVERRRFIYRGTVQGVGFRPTVYRVAMSLDLSGFVQNRSSEVLVEIQGDRGAVARFPGLLEESLPAAARIQNIEELALDAALTTATPPAGFRILGSAYSEYRFPPIPPDLAMCPDCARELLDPSDRRFLYPFITCTQCGPRYSIVEKTPFDRENTSMRGFSQCASCRAEYENPKDRRFHSQTNSCSHCGPRLSAVDAQGNPMPGDALGIAISALNEGKIVAIQGIGGFHLAADPAHPETMARLRSAKERERKPFALMTSGLIEARRLCMLSSADEALLGSPESPILIAPRSREAPRHLHAVSDTGTLGIMLPYTPLHLLLFRHPQFPLHRDHLVMTSGNRAGEPIATYIGHALERLSDTADIFLSNDRRILFRTDDSLLRRGTFSPPFMLRRSRGFVPRLIELDSGVEGTVLGIGGDLKSAPALARGRDVHLSPFLGDLEDPECLGQFESHIGGLLGLYGVSADIVVHDLHPQYRSTLWAERAGFSRRAAVQHHHAHALSVMAEHGLDEAIALCFDGTGYGSDGTIWGGEFIHATRVGFKRLGCFRPFPLPGGDSAVLHPPRIALAILADPSRSGSGRRFSGVVPGLDIQENTMIRAMMEKQLNSPLTSSLGRIFDAAASALGLVVHTGYEGEGPIRLEGAALSRYSRERPALDEGKAADLLPFINDDAKGIFTIDPAPLILSLLEERARMPLSELALVFHEAVAMAAREGSRRMKARTGIDSIVVSGGVLQNLLLRDLLIPLLKHDGFRVFLNERVPPGDGGLSLGQVYYVPQ